MKTTGWLKGLEVTAGGTGIVSHAGLALLRALSDGTGLTAGLSRALASGRLLIHDRGRVLANLACEQRVLLFRQSQQVQGSLYSRPAAVDQVCPPPV